MVTNQSDRNRILKEAKYICLELNQGLSVSDVFELHDGYAVVLANPTIRGHGPSLSAEVLNATSARLQTIKGVERVVIDVTSSPKT